MSNNTKHFVANQNIPEFIRLDHGLFETFVKAYYEWIELQNDSDSTNYSDVHKAVGNPGFLVNNQDLLVDIDDTLEEFIEFFASEVVPISLDGIQTNPRFFLKHIRDLYQSKGTIQSFKLFFKLYFNDDITVFETGENILRTSDGKYFAFPTGHFYITDFEEQLEHIDFTLATITDVDGNAIDTILAGGSAGRTPAGSSIVKCQFAALLDLKANTDYYIVNADGQYKIKVGAFVSLSEITLAETAPLYDENDPVYIDSLELDRRFFGSVTSVSTGKVNGIKVRNRGIFFGPNDNFNFENDGDIQGIFKVTKTGTSGDILEIDNIPLRTGSTNNGFTANNLEDVYIPITQGGSNWNQLPLIKYNPNSTTIIASQPYPKALTSIGIGFQSIPLTSTIGRANAISINQETFFKDSDDVFINPPANIIIENNDLKVGDKVSFQAFGDKANFEPLTDDSEMITMHYKFFRTFGTTQEIDYIYQDSEVERSQEITMIYGFDSDEFKWKTRNLTINSRNKLPEDLWAPLLLELDSDGTLNYEYETYSTDIEPLDGGQFNSFSDSEYDVGNVNFDSEFPNERWIDAGPTFDFVGSKVEGIIIRIQGKLINSLEDHHFKQLDGIIGLDSDLSHFDYEVVKGEPNLPIQDSDMGVWVDKGYYGEVIGISHNNQVAKVIGYNGSPLPTQTEIDRWSADKYSIVKVSPMDKNGVSRKDYSLPLTNVVHQIDRMRLNYKTSVISSLFKKFYTDDGFISSDLMKMRDNYYFSDHSYRIRSALPFENWKNKFKTMLHPAGMVLSSDYIQNMETGKVLDSKASSIVSTDFKPNMTFDQNQEYVDIKAANTIGADNIYYKANSFEARSILSSKARQLDASSQTSVPGLAIKQQSGNAWWDYEPIGWVRTSPIDIIASNTYNLDSESYFTNKFSTQDSDGTGNVLNTYTYFVPFNRSKQDLFKTASRQPKWMKDNYMISKVQFEDAGFVYHAVYDSDLPEDFMVTFVDSDSLFKHINYDRLLETNDTRYFPEFVIPRTAEIGAAKERDLMLAMRENGSLEWDDSDKVYTDFDAYERKWNQINNKRTKNIEGFAIKGYLPLTQEEHVRNRSKKRNKDFVDAKHTKYVDRFMPLAPSVWKADTIVWTNSYFDEINKTNIDPRYEKETYKDPRVSMRGRRK